jgi:uncharacterized protein YebE (UPF0316 family)
MQYLAGIVTLLAVAALSRFVGRALRGRPDWWYWTVTAVVFVVAVGLVFVSNLVGSDILWACALGFGFGGIAGLRYGWKDLFSAGRGSGA